jgi:hypothetical protein
VFLVAKVLLYSIDTARKRRQADRALHCWNTAQWRAVGADTAVIQRSGDALEPALTSGRRGDQGVPANLPWASSGGGRSAQLFGELAELVVISRPDWRVRRNEQPSGVHGAMPI